MVQEPFIYLWVHSHLLFTAPRASLSSQPWVRHSLLTFCVGWEGCLLTVASSRLF